MESTQQFPVNNVEKLQLSESVASHLREQIISGHLRTGEFLRVDTIAKALGTSTTPVREGLLMLQNESFVRLIPRRGFVVNSFSKDDLRDMFWAQAVIGAELAARAAMKMSPEDIEKLETLEAEHRKAIAAGDQPRITRLGHQFHRAINLAAQSPRLALLLGSLAKQLPNRFYTGIEGQLEGAVEYHPIIINAIRVKDPDAVRSLMYRHIISGAEHLIAMLDHQGTWGAPTAETSNTATSDSTATGS
ncbi:GntR family transcriptional regulator [Burkholderia diffusa]|uniref:GntR family transcriptional regulator n=1 Tax=Burkholderia diffusa TaxID=488732 RepID=UPI001FC815C0|nr:GntR family transcriptional regulator [Burkholderia diffusa]